MEDVVSSSRYGLFAKILLAIDGGLNGCNRAARAGL